MSDLLAKAGSVFLAPAAPTPAPRVAATPPGLVAVLAGERDLPVAAAGVVSALRRRHRARATLVAAPGPLPPRRPASRPAAELAQRLAARDLEVVAAGRSCTVALPADPDALVRDAWRAITAAAGVPAVVAVAERSEAIDALLREADLIVLGVPAAADPVYVELALQTLAPLATVARVDVPAGLVGRRLVSAGLAPLEWQAVPA